MSPNNDGGRPGKAASASISSDTESIPGTADLGAALRRRRSAAARLLPLPDGRPDPWTPRHRPRDLEASRAAWRHLHDVGLLADDYVREVVERALREAS